MPNMFRYVYQPDYVLTDNTTSTKNSTIYYDYVLTDAFDSRAKLSKSNNNEPLYSLIEVDFYLVKKDDQ